MARVAAVLLLVLVLAPSALGKTILGLKGQAARFESLTGQHTTVGHLIVGWGQGASWGSPFATLFETMGEIPMLGLSTRRGSLEAITPAQLAAGKGDDYLIALNAAIAAWGKPIYIRPFGEMNGYWNAYCAFTSSGKAKPGHLTASFRKAFARLYLIVHGGPAIELDAKLRKLGLPPVGRDLPLNPAPATKVIWNPQGFGNPNTKANSAQAYYPGDAYVDVVGNDLYDIRGKAEWAANEVLYRAHPKKPYAIPEWGLWGIDDPDFVRRMGAFARSHPRLELLAYFESVPGSVFDLATKPRSRAAYRSEITPLG
ncbi:MAG: glycosyl hydrolase [Gaiellaceae bacterium]